MQLLAVYTQFKYNAIDKSKRWKKIYHSDTNQRKPVVAILMSKQTSEQEKNHKLTRSQERYYILIKGSNHQDDRTILKVYASNNEPQNT